MGRGGDPTTRFAGTHARAQWFLVLRRPVGVVGMVTTWNYPISTLTQKMGPALAAGYTPVLKPAEATPLCARAVSILDVVRGYMVHL